jgi:hypothetical protein
LLFATRQIRQIGATGGIAVQNPHGMIVECRLRRYMRFSVGRRHYGEGTEGAVSPTVIASCARVGLEMAIFTRIPGSGNVVWRRACGLCAASMILPVVLRQI